MWLSIQWDYAHREDRELLGEFLADPAYRNFLAINGANLDVLETLSEIDAINAEEE